MAHVYLSVVVPVRDGAATIGACLDGLAAQEGAPTWELLVVDNGSRDDTVALVKSHPVGARLIHEPETGSYAARNAGIRATCGSVVAFTDADCVPEPGWLAAGVAALECGADLVGGRINQLVGPSPTLWETYDARHYLDQRSFVERHGFAATANLFVWRRVLEDIGAFDSTLLSSGDVEFSRRASQAGKLLVYDPGAEVGHWPRTTLRGTWRLHRRLGAGKAVLRARHRNASPRPAVRGRAPRPSPPNWRRRLRLLPVHMVVVSARFAGRITKRA